MIVRVFASGSGGNCLLVSSADTNIFIDAGISMRRVKTALANTDLTMEEIGGVLITHEHSDHISGIKMLCKHHKLPIYAPFTVAKNLAAMQPELEEFIHIIPVGESFQLGDISFRAFRTPHDTPESVGYRAETDEGAFALCTDMGVVTEEICQGLLGADTVLIESNHDENMLRSGPYPYSLKRRILSDRGHLSNENCAKLALYLAENGTERIILGHLSRENNSPELAYDCACRALKASFAKLWVAPVLGCLEIEAGTRVRA